MLTHLERFESAWDREAAGNALRPLALRFWGTGLLGLPELRLARLLGETVSARLLLLLLLVPHRAGAPRARSSRLRGLLEDCSSTPWILSADPASMDASAEALQLVLPKFLQLWDELVEDGRRDPERIARWCKPVDAPGALVEFEDLPDPEWAFQRSVRAETVLVDALVSRLGLPLREVSARRAREILGRILVASPLGSPLHRLQADAVALSLRAPFLVVSGGPGTGKTTVVAQILRALRRLLDLSPDSIALAAPTGRAQARLSESLRRALSPLADGEDPEDLVDLALGDAFAGTLHSLLGAHGDGTFRHGPRHPLPFRLVVVDEASMVDLHLFSVLVSALSPDSTLILLGDRDQLPSVETGAVLSDLVGNFTGASLSEDAARWLEEARDGIPVLDPSPAISAFHPLADRLVVLEQSFRSVPEISFAAGRILAYDSGWARTVPVSRLSDETLVPVSRLAAGIEPELDAWIAPICDGFRLFVASEHDPDRLRLLLEDRRILCVLHGGPSGRNSLNELVDRAVRYRLAPRSRGPYPGQQLLATRNRPDLDLRNGDLGVVADNDGRLRAAFPGSGGIRWVDLALAPELEPAWVLTVHKAQGSEFDEVLFVLPEVDTPLLDRPIVYTALTRARRIVRVQGGMDLLARALARVPDRPSRLRKVLGSPQSASGNTSRWNSSR